MERRRGMLAAKMISVLASNRDLARYVERSRDYLSAHAPRELRWAIVGPKRSRLEVVRASLPGPAYPAEILVADSSNPPSVDGVVRQARVFLAPQDRLRCTERRS